LLNLLARHGSRFVQRFLFDKSVSGLFLDIFQVNCGLSRVHELGDVLLALIGFLIVVTGGEGQRTQCNIQILVLPHHWLELTLVDATVGSDNFKTLVGLFVFRDRLVHWSVMLLVRREDVSDEWSFTRQKTTRDLKSFSMPKL